VSKSANKLLSNENSVEAVAIYGGVDAQIQTDIFSQSEVSKLLIVAATPGRLLDLLKNKDDTNCLSAFDNLQSIVFDEADRIAMNPEMTSQVDNILGVLNEQRNQKSIVSCLVSATLPEKAREVCDKWVPRSRFVVKIDSVKIGMEAPSIKGVDTDSTHDGIEDEGKSSKMAEATARKSNSNIDFASIPSHIVQTCEFKTNADNNLTRPKLTRLYSIFRRSCVFQS
jgi:superfamily II DNA/RNA helicase